MSTYQNNSFDMWYFTSCNDLEKYHAILWASPIFSWDHEVDSPLSLGMQIQPPTSPPPSVVDYLIFCLHVNLCIETYPKEKKKCLHSHHVLPASFVVVYVWGREWRFCCFCSLFVYQVNYGNFMHGLMKENVQLNRKVLSELSMHEPYSFKALVDISRTAFPGNKNVAIPPKKEGISIVV